MKKKLVLVLTILMMVSSLFAGGRREKNERDVEQKDSWKETFDIEGKRAGKYNVVVTATDIGGNVTTAGPLNIFIDPDSDLPVCSITNPRMHMCLPGNLNIVGTCVDDDAVERVEIILDDDEENPLVCEGKDFWSYYLDTTTMAEGRHTLSVYGIDINGVKGKEQKVTWHLNRRSPVTEVTSHDMGMLVSGKQKLTGLVKDGNGISSLSFSTDGGETYVPVKIENIKHSTDCSFEYELDTTLLTDGPRVGWFKAVDTMGTEGMKSFLFFVDNTKPDIQIVSPGVNEFVNGRFSIAGFAKDIIGLESLTWTFGENSGTIELIPGNPFFTIDCDVRNNSAKAIDFTIVGVDTANNTTTLVQKIQIDSALDKSNIHLTSPKANEVIFGNLNINGLALDDDGIQEVYYSIDGGEAVVLPSEGAFMAVVPELSAGNHSLKVWAMDIDGIAGNPTSVSFVAAGEAPVFGDAKLVTSTGENLYEAGITINPESKPVIKTSVVSGAGTKNVSWRFSGKESQSMNLSEAVKGNFDISIPVTDTRWGFVELMVTAEDIYGRKADYVMPLYVENLTKTRGNPGVYFTDSTISEDGVVIFDGTIPTWGYFVGGQATSVRLVPATKYGSVRLDGNSIVLEPGSVYGTSEPVKVEVTTNKGVKYLSKELKLCLPAPAPVVKLSDSSVRDGFNAVSVSGSVETSLSVKNVSAKFLFSDGLGGTQYIDIQNEFIKIDGKNFTVSCPTELIPNGMSVIEIIASDGSLKAANGVIVNKVTPDASKEAPKSNISWIEGEDIYGLAFSPTGFDAGVSLTANGSALSNNDDVFIAPEGCRVKRSSLQPGATSFEFATAVLAAGKPKAISAKHTVNLSGEVKMYFQMINDMPYKSGMDVVLPPLGSISKEVTDSMSIVIESVLPVSDVVCSLNGQDVKAVIRKNETPSQVYIADLPLHNLPATLTEIKATANLTGGQPVSISGTISVLRAKAPGEIADNEKVWWTSDTDAEGFYTIDNTNPLKTTLNAYGNFKAPFTASFTTAMRGIGVEVKGNRIEIFGTQEGEYKDIVLNIVDAEGISYTTEAIAVRVDNAAPQITWTVPEKQIWVQNQLKISGTVKENVAIKQAGWKILERAATPSIDSATTDGVVEGATDGTVGTDVTAADTLVGLKLSEPKAGVRSFENLIDLTDIPDGIVTVVIVVTDTAGKTTTVQKVVHKDTMAPEVTVLLPEAETTINGENRIVFDVNDAGKLAKAEYVTAEGNRYPMESTPLMTTMVGTKEQPIQEDMIFEFTDVAGNVTRKNTWDFIVDAQSDLPVTEIHVPEEMEIITTDFVISGVVYDDDGESKIWYKIDDNEYQALEGYGSSYSIPVPLSSMTDNEHTVTIYAEDLRGVKGEEVVRTFRISLEEPKGEVLKPAVEETVKGYVTLSGVTSDKNGIEKVQISIDNGNTYVTADGTEEWSYTFDTHIIEDGTHVVFLKVWDKYGIQGLYSSLLNIDNTAPNISLELPRDDTRTSGMLFFSGETTDNIGLEKLYMRIRNLDKTLTDVPGDIAHVDLIPDDIITRSVDLSALKDGFYNVEITGEDAGGNISRVSRNIQLDRALSKASVDILYPLDNEDVTGTFNIYGKVTAEKAIDSIILYVDDASFATTTLSDSGYYKFELSADVLTTGKHKYKVRTILNNGEVIDSVEHDINYSAVGPWISVDSLSMGDFAINRPFMKGRADYNLSEEDLALLKAKDTPKEVKKAIQNKSLELVEISFDNGRNFVELSEKENWEYRIENSEMTEGYHFMVLRATMKNGEKALTRMIIQIDKTAPFIRLISPNEGGSYNQELEFSGLASDDVKLSNVHLALRTGDKSSYEVPGFIQGLYFDVHGWGATLWDVGLGLTFFDDNVKIQVQYGQFTDEQWKMFESTKPKRYGGHVFGAKLLANIFYFPFSYIGGPDWSWLSTSLAVGANFSLFTETQSGTPQMLSAVLVQWEFPRITLPRKGVFRTFSFYTEFQLWFASTDVKTADSKQDVQTFVPHITGGLRLNVF